jgi:hypothetical protein
MACILIWKPTEAMHVEEVNLGKGKGKAFMNVTTS